MRIAIGQLWQETNTFNRNPTTLDDFENWGIATGHAVETEYGETGELGGFIAACREWRSNVEFVGLARYVCWPWGAVDTITWKQIQSSFAEQLENMGQVDALFLALHGAMAADGEPDLTGALLEQARQAVGPDVPIVGTLDLHANITRRMIENANALAGYHACPHLDAFETGQRAARALQTMIDRSARPATFYRKLPMITAAENHNTFTGVPAPLYRKLEQLETEPDILTTGLYMAMPWFDAPELGWTVTLTAKSRNTKWEKAVNDLADQCWEIREKMEDVERFPPDVVIQKALAVGDHPVVIGDGADATNSGSPGDSTHLLRELLKQDSIPHGAFIFLVDPDSVATAYSVGLGSRFDAMIGATFAPEYSEPVHVRGTVERLLDVDFILDGHIGKNFPIHMGRGAVVKSGDVSILLVEKSGPGSSPKLYETAGLDPKSCGIVVAKSPAGFRADYDPFVAEALLADCPGCAAPNWSRLNFHQVHRPLSPLNRLESPEEASWCKSRWSI